MAEHTLIIAVYMMDGRYHGVGDWPPSPFRLFQALVAAAHLGRAISAIERTALTWFEHLEPPVIAVPSGKKSKTVTYYMPNNSLDTVEGNPFRIAEIRRSKEVVAWLFDERIPFLYAWPINANEALSEEIGNISKRLYQFGRGVDMAYAVSESIDSDALERVLANHGGNVYRPTPQGSGGALRCPKGGSFKSLIKRHAEQLKKLRSNALCQASPPVYNQVVYDSPPARLLFDLVRNDSKGGYYAQAPEHTAGLTERIRDLAARRLEKHFGRETVQRIIVGRYAGEADKSLRIRIVPLPSIGSVHADRRIRRVLIEVPPACPIQSGDIAWAFNGLDLGCDVQTGEVLDDAGPLLVPSDSREMLSHYGIEDSVGELSRIWRSVTPIALPFSRMRGQISGNRRLANGMALTHDVRQALRHAGLDSTAEVSRIQREPFDVNGTRAEVFSYGKRFSSRRLYHVEITFEEPIAGPVVIGDGRYLGLGLLAPLQGGDPDAVVIPLKHESRPLVEERRLFLHAVRRALMARARDITGAPGRFFSGHEPDGTPARSGGHNHVFLAADDVDDDGRIDLLLVIAPWRADRSRRAKGSERSDFYRVATSLQTVRAGRQGVIEFETSGEASPDDRVFRSSKNWISKTPYVPTRYPKRGDEIIGVSNDLMLECARRGLPRPKVEITYVKNGRNGGITVNANLQFEVTVRGPLLLGRDCHEGGGLFVPVD